jgi:hypothetical protein
MSPPSSESKYKPRKKPSWSRYQAEVGIFFGFFFDHEDGGDVFLRNFSCLSTDYTA